MIIENFITLPYACGTLALAASSVDSSEQMTHLFLFYLYVVSPINTIYLPRSAKAVEILSVQETKLLRFGRVFGCVFLFKGPKIKGVLPQKLLPLTMYPLLFQATEEKQNHPYTMFVNQSWCQTIRLMGHKKNSKQMKTNSRLCTACSL